MGWWSVAKILYNALNAEAKAKSALSVVGELDRFSNLNNIKTDKTYPSFFIPQNKNTAYLNGNLTIPDEVSFAPLIFKNVSDTNGFVNVSLVIELDKVYASGGLTFLFNVVDNIYATEFSVKWYLGTELKERVDIINNKLSYYTIFKKVKNFNKIVLNLKRMNLPQVKPIITGFEIGVKLTFLENAIESVNIFEEIDPLLETLSTNTCDFVIKSQLNLTDLFLNNQKIIVFKNDIKIGEFYTKNIERISKNKYKIGCVDRLYYLDNLLCEGRHTMDYNGRIFWLGTIGLMLYHVKNEVGIEYRIPNAGDVDELGTYYKTDTPRNLLQIILFMLGLTLDLSRDGVFKIYKLNKNNKKHIDIKDISADTKLEKLESVTDLKLKYFELGDCYNNDLEPESKICDLPVGTNYIKFESPYFLDTLRVVNGRVLDSNNLGLGFGLGVNITCESKGELYGQKIKIFESLLETPLPDTESETTRNVKEFNDIYCLGVNTVTMVKNRLIDFYKNPYIYKATTVYENLKLGDFVEIDDPNHGLINGWVISLDYNLNGNKIFYDMEVKLC